MKIKEVCEYYKKDLDSAEKAINGMFRAVAPAISEIGKYMLDGGGKRIRPLLAILSSKIFNYQGEKTDLLACAVESIHTASLLHDDIVDDASVRRGRPPAHSVWGDKLTILVGDYLYTNAMRVACSLNDQRIMEALSGATAKMSEGEVLQLGIKGDFDISEEEYMEIIKDKTAILISSVCLSGAILGQASKKHEAALSSFGLKLGLAFQIADDVLDYMAEEKALGKSLGKDLEEGKITLPLIYLLQSSTSEEVEKVKSIIRAEKMFRSDLSYITGLLEKYQCIEKSYEKANSLIEEAKAALHIFEDSMEKSSLLTIADYALKREK
ncbi:MAG: polyprenyl synthetase family protein [Nitrospirae bacterium]|nr:polyprenyl synthetase family protein [Nitrospirota bacterium]